MGPQINIIGSFFPSWMLCAAIGIVAALLGRWLFDPHWGSILMSGRQRWSIRVLAFSSRSYCGSTLFRG